MRRSRAGRWAARIAATTVSGGLLLLAVPAHAAPSGQPGKPRATHTRPAGIPIDLQVGTLGVHIVLPDLGGILGGRRSTAPSTPPKTTSGTPLPTPPATSRTPSRPSRPSRTHHNPLPSRTLHAPPPAATSPAGVPLVATTHPTRPAHKRHRPTHRATHRPRSPSPSPVRHRNVAAGQLNIPPTAGDGIALLLAVIAAFGIGVLGIVVAGGRRGEPRPKHRH